ncbi:hypothetical protein PPYR_15428 [Photinus pyralis]|uniref:YqaJ viral recombinase domain-containing protein n=1 Tax=Photinus pyralis TaxID=7054 RepID=A0A5N3ZYV5_PHOPY|nr:hypothetical protein PPYR_15428 [Photinus pyralis]
MQYFRENIAVSIETALDIAMTTVEQNNDIWKNHRKLRITGSRCYELFTYCKNKDPNWKKKLFNIINSTFHGNIYTDYGNKYESFARKAYERQFGKVYCTGLVINPSLPWIAFSPNELKMHFEIIYKTIEIKCPVLGASSGVNDFITTLPYIKYDGRKIFPY